jgi:hypothetical protein
MNRILVFALTACCLSSLSAQLTVRVTARNQAGAAVDMGGSFLANNFAKGTTFPEGHSHQKTASTDRKCYSHLSVDTRPVGGSTWLRSESSVETSTIAQSAHSTGDKLGRPDWAQFRITLSSPTPIRVLGIFRNTVSVSHPGGRSRIKFAGPGISTSYDLASVDLRRDFFRAIVVINGSVDIDVDVSSLAVIGGSKKFNTSSSSVDMNFLEVQDGSFTLYGKGCSTAEIGSTTTPRQGDNFTLTLEKAPAFSMKFLLVGPSRDRFHFLPLPYDLTGLGMPGCDLNVGYKYSAYMNGNGSTSAKLSATLPAGGGIFYAQWVIYEIFPGKTTLTRGAEIRY